MNEVNAAVVKDDFAIVALGALHTRIPRPHSHIARRFTAAAQSEKWICRLTGIIVAAIGFESSVIAYTTTSPR